MVVSSNFIVCLPKTFSPIVCPTRSVGGMSIFCNRSHKRIYWGPACWPLVSRLAQRHPKFISHLSFPAFPPPPHSRFLHFLQLETVKNPTDKVVPQVRNLIESMIHWNCFKRHQNSYNLFHLLMKKAGGKFNFAIWACLFSIIFYLCFKVTHKCHYSW